MFTSVHVSQPQSLTKMLLPFCFSLPRPDKILHKTCWHVYLGTCFAAAIRQKVLQRCYRHFFVATKTRQDFTQNLLSCLPRYMFHSRNLLQRCNRHFVFRFLDQTRFCTKLLCHVFQGHVFQDIAATIAS